MDKPKIFCLVEKEFIIELIKIFRETKRIGSDIDIPEGARCISISDTLAKNIAERLEKRII